MFVHACKYMSVCMFVVYCLATKDRTVLVHRSIMCMFVFNDRAALVHAARAAPSEEISLSSADSVTLYHQHLLP